MSLLELRDLRVTYTQPDGSPLDVLNLREFTLDAGARACVRGHSGSGKTTLLNVISGIRLPTSGSVTLDGLDLVRLSEAERDQVRGSRVGFVFQTFNLLQGFTALENVVLGSVFAGDPDEEPSATRRRALDLLAKVGLGGRVEHRPRMMSSGEQQRVAIARALMNRPKLILADEPTGALDEAAGRDVLDLILSLATASGAALLLVTHDPAVMAKFERVVDLKELGARA